MQRIQTKARESRPAGDFHACVGNTPSKITAFAYSETDLLECVLEDVQEIPDLLKQWPVVWLNLDGPGDIKTLEFFRDQLGLHPLALEDVVNLGQRPKVEAYDDHLFVVMRMLHEASGSLATEQLSLFLGRGFLISFQGDRPGDCLEALRERLRSNRGVLRQKKADYLAYALVDTVIDHYFPICDWLDERLDSLETQIVKRLTKDAPERVLATKQQVLLLKRILRPTRDVVSSLQRNDLQLFDTETLPYLRDCYDHANRLLDTVESQRDLAASLLDLYLSLAADRTNSVMRFLTLISTIFIPLTFVAGVYGMNFDPASSPWNMPELRWRYGYPFSLGLMAVVALLLTGFFYLRGWLERPKK
ncbi:MAG: magnesium/cobalt transporter CorA [Polyangiaceae bacterium]|nr:magnesium/cobalt transporter CorA [Polyangiaceae bacterium]